MLIEAVIYLYTSMYAKKLHGTKRIGFYANKAISSSYMMCIDKYSYIHMCTPTHILFSLQHHTQKFTVLFCERPAISGIWNMERAIYIQYFPTKI